MEYGNVLVLGDSGVGKSTLINAVLGENAAKTGYGTEGTTKYLEVYTNDEIKLRLIDTVGFEPDFIKRKQAIDSVRKWSKDAAKVGDANSAINVIWFCVDGTSRKLFKQSIDSLIKATRVFKSVPVIAVITKSYSEPDREENIQMVREAFAKYRKKLDLECIIPVVAQQFNITDNVCAPESGLDELLEKTRALVPTGIKAARSDMDKYKLNMMNGFAQGLIGTSTAAGATVGLVNIIPMSDAAVLSTLELAEVEGLAKIYNVKKNDDSNKLIKKIVELGTVSAIAKAACGAILKAIPVAGQVANSAVAGTFVAAIGEGSRYIFEQIYQGNKSVNDLDWVEKVLNEKLSDASIKKAQEAFKGLKETSTKDDIAKAIQGLFK